LPGNELAGFLQRLLRGQFKPATAGHLHAHDGDGLDVVLAQDLRQLLGVVNRIELGASDKMLERDIFERAKLLPANSPCLLPPRAPCFAPQAEEKGEQSKRACPMGGRSLSDLHSGLAFEIQAGGSSRLRWDGDRARLCMGAESWPGGRKGMNDGATGYSNVRIKEPRRESRKPSLSTGARFRSGRRPHPGQAGIPTRQPSRRPSQ
jgi:hypothetical protein